MWTLSSGTICCIRRQLSLHKLLPRILHKVGSHISLLNPPLKSFFYLAPIFSYLAPNLLFIAPIFLHSLILLQTLTFSHFNLTPTFPHLAPTFFSSCRITFSFFFSLFPVMPDYSDVQLYLFSLSHSATVNCTLCSKGHYTDGPGSTKCGECQEGTYTNTNGSIVCKPCPPGSFCKLVYINSEPYSLLMHAIWQLHVKHV